MTSGTSGATSR